MFRPYTKDKQFIHHLNKEKTNVYHTFYSVKIRFFSVREILVSHSNLWDIIYN